MLVSQILRAKGHAVIDIAKDASLLEAAQMLTQHSIGALLITHDDGSPAGILSERDIVQAIAREGDDALSYEVSSCMSSPVAICTDNDTVEELMERMTYGRFRHIPVVKQNRVIGLVSIGDVVKARIDEATHESEALKSYIAAN